MDDSEKKGRDTASRSVESPESGSSEGLPGPPAPEPSEAARREVSVLARDRKKP